ncbi:uncharacterized protein LOC129911160 [Episyrphus balteatus]|uniref:uncharacterized protein LOC129911160 n=1 Tax=Episyrphus balteatus TaxID=286459 RepID=UPI002485928F|nr:uncharacterized protein LOC129911160 [Episyrphus balteatus]
MWNTENTLNLIADLEKNPCLWDISSPLYKLRDKKYEAYEELGEKYCVTPSEVEKKVQSLKSQFRREHKKVKDTEKKAKVKCNWFGYAPLMFLRDGVEAVKEKNVFNTAGVKSDVLYNTVEPDENSDINEMDYSSTMDSQSQSGITAITDIPPTVIKTESSELGNNTLECMKTLIDFVTKRDEFSIYGDHIAEKLRNSEKSKMEIHIA